MITNIAIHGAAGRMGRRLVALGSVDPELRIVAAVEYPQHPEMGKDAGLLAGVNALGVPLTGSLHGDVQAVIDFSVPEGASNIIDACLSRKVPLVMATTGLANDIKARLNAASNEIPIVWSPSMSTTVNLAMKLVATAGMVLKNTSSGVDVEIIERHHRFKEDSPSGTALKFGEIVAATMGQTEHRHGRDGAVGKRPLNEIGYHAVRTGDNPGEHTIIFGLLGETLEINVKASNRDCYALGALQAAKFAAQQKPGMYNMYDVLGL
ncbi:4-hydroxy-tetrahydrodipicolinate reductase [Anatilimnocola aggregata]|uniref:4-hydroxy-tetrahydrodipicolinate reductase n=1 Tax=Anatilimnocola aggregata TaxID=2528021 RepID=A0A517Y4L4_9BACT|nr:4-hydroxy-tetrahydrodipicolinate reductase [Anatilimnocola aggregata]QDU25188.1 4-hydroxy-tetrahydrodipicolinate reductase [Anatilimnocola aggregata]